MTNRIMHAKETTRSHRVEVPRLPKPKTAGVRIAAALFVIIAAGLIVGRAVGWVPFSWLEIVAAVTGAACVLLVVARSVWNFPVGIVSCVAYIVFFADGKLYAEAGLQGVFILMAIHGWLAWAPSCEEQEPEVRVRRIPIGELTLLAVLFPLAWLGLTRLLEYVGGASPTLDAFVAALSIAAQWMLNRRYIENWLGWIVIDQVSIALFLSREMYLTAGLYAVFLGMCAAGLVEWRRNLIRGEA
jgi:nicotinamide mononucleotide transporter